MKCGRCGAVSVWERHFERRAWGFGHRGMLCPWCRLHLEGDEALDIQHYLIGIGLILAALHFWSAGVVSIDWTLLIPAAYAGLIVAHELAHAVVGRLVGLRIHAIRIGDGRVILRLRLGRTRVGVGSLFLFAGGHCIVTYPGKPARWRDALCSGAPLVMHAALVPLSIAWGWPGIAIAINILFLLANAYPTTSSEGVRSDGGDLVALLRNEDDHGGWKYCHLYYPIHFALRDGRSQEAFTAAERALAHYPGYEGVQECYVQAAVRTGRYESALDAIPDYDQGDPNEDDYSPEVAALGRVHPRNRASTLR